MSNSGIELYCNTADADPVEGPASAGDCNESYVVSRK